MIRRESEQVDQVNKAPPEMHYSSLQELLMKRLASPASEALSGQYLSHLAESWEPPAGLSPKGRIVQAWAAQYFPETASQLQFLYVSPASVLGWWHPDSYRCDSLPCKCVFLLWSWMLSVWCLEMFVFLFFFFKQLLVAASSEQAW